MLRYLFKRFLLILPTISCRCSWYYCRCACRPATHAGMMLACLVRSQFLALREREFVEAARAQG